MVEQRDNRLCFGLGIAGKTPGMGTKPYEASTGKHNRNKYIIGIC